MDPNKFQFIQKDQKIYDQKIEGKPISSMKDVMIRFTRNRTNVTATIILAIIVLCSFRSEHNQRQQACYHLL